MDSSVLSEGRVEGGKVVGFLCHCEERSDAAIRKILLQQVADSHGHFVPSE